MNNLQICTNTSDAIPLYLPQQLFLKPIARINISLQLPQMKMGKSISNWEVMERIRYMIKPEAFSLLKVTKTNLEFIRFEAEIEDQSKLQDIIIKIDNKTIKLKEFPEVLKLRAAIAKLPFPSRHTWDTFFQEARDMNEMKAGERPDTIHISNLPIKWFVPYHLTNTENIKPSEKMFYRVFEKFGQIKRVDIPICDPYRSKMKAEVTGMQMFDFNEEHFFEGYVQFKDYIGFSKTMNALRGMKLLYKGGDEMYTVNINVDFDRTKHLSDASVRRREIVRDRLVKKELDREEQQRSKMQEEECKLQVERQKEVDKKNAKEQRRQQREEKRKRKILDKLKVKGAYEINQKIAKEEKKLLKVQRKLEAIRLLEELFKRIKNKKEKNITIDKNDNADELTRFKNSSELEVRQQQEKLHRVIEGKVVLKSILGGGPRINKYEDMSSSDSSSKEIAIKKNSDQNVQNFNNDLNSTQGIPLGNWYEYPYPHQIPAIYSTGRGGHPLPYFPYIPRGRTIDQLGRPSTSRGFNNYRRNTRNPRYRGGFRNKYGMPPEMQDEYFKYFEKFVPGHDGPSTSYSKSPSRHQRTKVRSRSRSYSKRRKSYSYSRSRSRSKSYCRRSRSNSRTSSKRSYDGRHTPPAKQKSIRDRSRSRTIEKAEAKGKYSRSPRYKSIGSSKFTSPSRSRMRRSKSWSLPKEGEESGRKRSWSKSPSPKK